MTNAEERLAMLLDEKDARIIELEEKIENLGQCLAGSEAGWSMPRAIADEHPDLPLPRLEFAWTPSKQYGWKRFTVEYRLLYQHMVGCVTVIPLGLTTTSGGGGLGPFDSQWPNGVDLPYRDGSHAHHDAAHLRLPLYALTPSGPVRLDREGQYPRQRVLGAEHRRELEGKERGEKSDG